MKLLSQSFFRRPAEIVAPELLGATLVSTIGGMAVSGTVTEVEAYLGFDDPASHAFRGRRHAGNEGLYSPAGFWYVYRSYGIHWCANLVVGGPAGSAVLLRAMVPRHGLETMRRRRHGVADHALADGPGKLCQAIGMNGAEDGVAMRSSRCRVYQTPERPADSPLVTPRIGITKAADWPLRFVLPGLRGQ